MEHAEWRPAPVEAEFLLTDPASALDFSERQLRPGPGGAAAGSQFGDKQRRTVRL